MPPVGRPLGFLLRRQLHLHPHNHAITPSIFSVSARRQSTSLSPANRKLNLPIDFNASSLLAHSSTTALSNPELPQDFRASATTKRMNYFQAVNDALATILEADEKAYIFGEDVAFGGNQLHPPPTTFSRKTSTTPGWLVPVRWANLGRRFPLHHLPQRPLRLAAGLQHPTYRTGNHRVRHRPRCTGSYCAAGDSIRRLHVPRLRPITQ